jgi:hypothetical protein
LVEPLPLWLPKLPDADRHAIVAGSWLIAVGAEQPIPPRHLRLRLVRWKPFSADQVPRAVLSGRVESRMADCELAATLA